MKRIRTTALDDLKDRDLSDEAATEDRRSEKIFQELPALRQDDPGDQYVSISSRGWPRRPTGRSFIGIHFANPCR